MKTPITANREIKFSKNGWPVSACRHDIIQTGVRPEAAEAVRQAVERKFGIELTTCDEFGTTIISTKNEMVMSMERFGKMRSFAEGYIACLFD
jgi:hypothetical protein